MSSLENNGKNLVAEIAFKETLELLDWPRIGEHLSQFASTPQGLRACKILALPEDLETSRLLLAETMEMRALDDLIEGGLSFEGVHDLSNVLQLCQKGAVVSGEELLRVAETLSAARRLRRQIDSPEFRPKTTNLLRDLSTLPELEKVLRFGLEEGGRVADRASERLSRLRRQSQALRLERRECFQGLLKRYVQILQDTVVAERQGRPVLAVKAGAAAQVKGMVYDSSASGNTVFVEPQLVIPLGNQIVEIEAHILEEEQLLLKKWSEAVGANFYSLSHLTDVLLQLDLAMARARYGRWLGGVPPRLQGEPDAPFILHDLRHPLLIWQQRHEKGDVVVPVSLEVPNHLRVVAITGPNTGGKTVTLKSVGLAALMARAGLLLPCTGSPSLPWCANVLADIGDEQSLQQNLSTFSGHIIRIGRILDALAGSTGNALVLLDEVGAGTDPSEGSALAISLLKTLADRARLTIATTHFGELKALKYSDSRFENASVAFDIDSMAPTFRLQWGIPGRSNALAIAKRLGLEPALIDQAQQLVGPNAGEEVNKIILGLEQQRQRQQDAAEDAAALLARTELLHEELLDRWQKQCQQSAQLQELGRKKLEISIREGQKEVRSLIKRLREEGANGETARQVGQQLRRMEQEHLSRREIELEKGWFPKVGERIRLLALGKSAEVLAISDDGVQLTVLCGLFRSTVELAGVESLDGLSPKDLQPQVKVQAKEVSWVNSEVRTVKNTVDVRGLRVHEAEVAVEEYLRHAHGCVWVIHGIGTGKLKRGLRRWLESVPYVNRVSDADQNDGGAGCSVVWLR